jgi:hypothetical protein
MNLITFDSFATVWLRIARRRPLGLPSCRLPLPQATSSLAITPRRAWAVLLVAATSLAPTAAALQSAPQSPATSLYAPNNRVPLSEFVEKGASPVVMHVFPEVLQWVVANTTTQVAVLPTGGGTVSFHTATAVDANAGTVTFDSTVTGTCVVVCPLMHQDLSVVTHWESPNPARPRGGQLTGAYGALNPLDVDLTENELIGTGTGIGNQNPAWGDAHGVYTWATDLYALFSDGTGGSDSAAYPALERYIGETYSITGPTPLAALWLSDWCRAQTGFPIAHRSHPYAFDTSAPVYKRVANNLPVFQIVHGHVVAPSTTSASERSLGTFILPPGWTKLTTEGYPALFNSFYDLNGSVFGSVGRKMLETLAELHTDSGGQHNAVGIIWNGGGSQATYTTHPSAYDNAARLIADAGEKLLVDPNALVFSGGSRGGIAALAIASNPKGFPYSARFVNSYVPFPRLGSSISGTSPTHGLGLTSMPGVVGWIGSWMESWGMGGLSGLDLTMQNLFEPPPSGTSHEDYIDDQLSIDSPSFISSLAAELGSQGGVVLRLGTHDAHRPSAYVVEYYDRLRAAGIQVHFEIFYRYGHGIPLDTQPNDRDLLEKVFNGTGLNSQLLHYRRQRCDPDLYEGFTPTHIPLVFETAKQVGQSQAHAWSFFGEPGARVQVYAAPTTFNAWPTSGWSLWYSGYLVPETATSTFGTLTFSNTLTAGSGRYAYFVWYSPNGTPNWNTDPKVGYSAGPPERSDFAAWEFKPSVLITATPTQSLEELFIADGARSGGVSEDAQFEPNTGCGSGPP